MSTPLGPAQQTLALALAGPWPLGRPRVIAIDGPSGSGKSTLARLVAGPGDAPVVHLDDLYDGWEGLAAGVDHLVDGILARLARGEAGSAPRYDWRQGRYDGVVEVPAAPLVVVEGVGSGSRACAPYLTLLVWVEADEGLARAVARDGAGLRPRLLAWHDLETRHHAEEGTRERADLVVTT